jgi:DNA-binding LacI/PurR family transcriptional regulator
LNYISDEREISERKMQKRNVTIKDIANELKISPSTVSKALKGHPDISTSTKNAVTELVERWNYKPNPLALSLQGGLSRTIGVIVPEIAHYFFSTVIGGIEDLAYESGYHVMFCQSSELYDREVKAVNTLLSCRVDGILVSVSKMTNEFSHFTKIIDNGVHLVFFDRICCEIDTDRVIVDDEEGAFEAVKHLINIGCKNIVHLSGPSNLQIGINRKEGYLRALREFNIPIEENNIIKCDTGEDASKIVPGLLSREVRPDGIFAVNDLTATSSMKTVLTLGYRVPEDVAIVGFTSGLNSDLTSPTLTSVKQNGYLIGREAVRMLIDRIEKKTTLSSQTRIIKTELLIKGSTVRNYM